MPKEPEDLWKDPKDALTIFDVDWARICDLAEWPLKGHYHTMWHIQDLPEFQTAFDAMEALRHIIKERAKQ